MVTSGPCFEQTFHSQKVKVNEPGSRVHVNQLNEIHTDGRATFSVYKIQRYILDFINKKKMLILLCSLSVILTSRENKHNHIRNFSESTLST